jgi:hypothetical protein
MDLLNLFKYLTVIIGLVMFIISIFKSIFNLDIFLLLINFGNQVQNITSKKFFHEISKLKFL